MSFKNVLPPVLLAVVALAISALYFAHPVAGNDSASPPSAGLWCDVAQSPGAAPVIVQFDTETAGTRIAEQYAGSGIHFLNDYQADKVYRSSPQIQTHTHAHSTPNVLVNDYYDSEFFSSHDVPLVLWTDFPLSGVGMFLGTTESWCTPQATVSLYDCNGFLRGQKTVAVSSAFNTPLQVDVDDANHPAQLIVIDYGHTSCPEAIDSFAVQPVSGQCTDSLAPMVTVTSHAAAELVNDAQQIIEGYVTETGILKSVKVNGATARFYRKEGFYYFRYDASLSTGSNTFSIVAENGSGGKGSAQIVLTLGVPKSASLAQFHLTQRGVVKNSACDVDDPFVAGKPALVRVSLDVETSGGQSTYASAVEMSLWRKGQSTAVETYWGTTYSPFVSQFNSPNHMTAVHFWIPAADVDLAGDYRFTFQPYVGATKIGSPLTVWCTSSEYFYFAETNPVRLFILPAEAGVNNPNHTADHAEAFFGLLAAMERTYPVRQGVSSLAWPSVESGIKYLEGAPFHFCDGTATMQQNANTWCKGTGWEWTFIDKDPGGTLRRTDLNTVTNPDAGVEVAANQTLAFTPQIGIFRGGAHPGDWQKSFPIFDEDHNGAFSNADRLYFIKSYLDADDDAGLGQPSWISVTTVADLAYYDVGERMRFFWDKDGNGSNNEHTEDNTKAAATQAPVILLWNNAGKVIHGPALEAMNAYNKSAAGTQADAEYASLWFPILVHPDTGGWRFYGPGSASGKENWIRVRNKSTMAHELGHSLGGLTDLYLVSLDPAADDLVTKENAWAVYIYYKAKDPATIYGVMATDRDPDQVVFIQKNYKALFDKLWPPSPLSSQRAGLDQQFIARGSVDAEGALFELDTDVGSELEITPPDETSPYVLVFGQGEDTLLEHRFPLFHPTNVQNEPETEPGAGYFNVVAPYPVGTGWVELRFEERVLAHLEPSATAPTANLLAPNNGGSFGANDEIWVEWQAGDQDGDELVSALYYSPNGGESWLPVASGLTGSPYLWQLGNVPGAADGQGLLKVEVSDGFHSGEDLSDEPFAVEGKPPLLSILFPASDERFLQCEHVRVRGAALDPEGELAQPTWILDGEVAGETLEADLGPLAPGDHHLVLEVEDGQGLIAHHEVLFHVLPDSDCDTMSDDFELLYGLELSYAGDAGDDGDHDGLLNLDEAWWGTEPDNPDTDGDGYSDGYEVEHNTNPRDPGDPPAGRNVYLPLILCAGR